MDETHLKERIGRLLKEHGLTVTTAESCTGGLLANFLTDVDGSSNYYRQGAVTYSNEAKRDILGVSQKTLDEFGPVSPQTALRMARGVRLWAEADVGLATTGLAGPQGEPGKPVGLVYISLSTNEGTICIRQVFSGGRLEIKRRAALKALEMLLGHLEHRHG